MNTLTSEGIGSVGGLGDDIEQALAVQFSELVAHCILESEQV